MARVNEVVREALGDELERLSDPRLGLVTVTGVDVSADLRQATVYYSALGRADEAGYGGRAGTRAGATGRPRRPRSQAAAPHLRASLGRQVRLKYTPELTFREDPAIAPGNRIEAIIRDLHRDDDRRTAGRVDDVTERRRRSSRGAVAAPSPAADQVALACHVNPDGDALGSMLGLFHVLRAAGRDVVASFPQPVRRRAALPRAARASTCSPTRPSSRAEPDVMVTFDCGSLGRLGDLETVGQGRTRADRARPPRVEHPLRHHQRDRPGGRRQRRARAPPRRTSSASRSPTTPRSRSTPRSCATPGASSTRPPRPSVFDLARELVELRRAGLAPVAPAVRGAPLRVPQAARRGAGQRRARRRATLRVDRRHPGHARRATTSPSRRSRASSTSCAAPPRPRSPACSRRRPTARCG